MSHVLGDAGRAMVKAMGAALLVVLIGITHQNTLHGAVAVGIAGCAAIGAAGLAAFQVFVPEISFRAYLPEPWGSMADSFVHAGLPVFLVAVIGFLNEPNYSAWHSVLIGAVTGFLNAGFRAIQGGLTKGERPSPHKGLETLAGTRRAALVPA